MTKQVVLRANELADLYGLRTLYDYLQEIKFEADITFSGHPDLLDKPRARELTENCQVTQDLSTHSDLAIWVYSDITSGSQFSADKNVLELDLTILKNCVLPMTAKQKTRLKKKYDITYDQPVLVLSYPEKNGELEQRVIETLQDKCQIYVIGELFRNNNRVCPCGDKWKCKHKSNLTLSDSVKFIDQYGVLKDYYAMADAALNAVNLKVHYAPLHNFVEATEGGPLFMAPTKRGKQYGYKQLCERKVIRELSCIDEILEAVQEYIKNPEQEKHAEQRAQHLKETREKYLPAIVEQMTRSLRTPNRTRGLNISRQTKITISHPDTDWSYYDESKPTPPKPNNAILQEENKPIIITTQNNNKPTQFLPPKTKPTELDKITSKQLIYAQLLSNPKKQLSIIPAQNIMLPYYEKGLEQDDGETNYLHDGPIITHNPVIIDIEKVKKEINELLNMYKIKPINSKT